MVLKRKIFSSLLLPHLLIVALIFAIALWALKKEIAVASKETTALLAKEEKEKKSDLANLFEKEIGSLNGEIKSLLHFVKVQNEIEDPLRLVIALGSIDSIDLVQLSKEGRNFTYLPKKASQRRFDEIATLDQGAMVEIEKRLYFALPLGNDSSLLFDWNALSSEERSLLQQGAKEKKEYQKGEPLSLFLPFYVNGFTFGGKKIFPSGIGHFDEKGGFGYLGEDFFFCESFSKKGDSFATDNDKNLYLVHGEEIGDQLFLTLGFSLDEKVKALAVLADDDVSFNFPDGTRVGYSSNGVRWDNSLLLTDQKMDMLSFTLGDKSTLTFFTDKTQKERPLVPFLLLNNHLFQVLVFGLLIAAVVFLLFALLVFWYLSGRVLKPLDVLASAQARVAEGKYEEVEISEVAKRKDEIGLLATTFLSMVESLKEREKMRAILNKVVSKEVAEEILREPVHLGGEDRIVTMLFADIRDFSRIIAHFPPQKVVELLNGFMTKMTRVIEGEGGVIDKYIGDQIMALFGAPASHPDHAIRSLASAKLMTETLKKWNEERARMDEPLINIGIGIHTGLVVAGNMGTEDRLNYTVIGSDVTLAARLCQAAKGGQILISEFTLNEPHVKNSFEVKELEPLFVKGFEEAVKVYEVISFKWEKE